MKRFKRVAEHVRNVSRCALRSSTAGSIGVGTCDGRREGKKGHDATRRGRHGLFLNIRIWYRSVFAFLTGQSLKMGFLSNALIIKTCQNSIVIVFMLIQTQLYRSSYRGFFACLVNLIRGSVTGLLDAVIRHFADCGVTMEAAAEEFEPWSRSYLAAIPTSLNGSPANESGTSGGYDNDQ